jgi:hypothetical protein
MEAMAAIENRTIDRIDKGIYVGRGGKVREV